MCKWAVHTEEASESAHTYVSPSIRRPALVETVARDCAAAVVVGCAAAAGLLFTFPQAYVPAGAAGVESAAVAAASAATGAGVTNGVAATATGVTGTLSTGSGVAAAPAAAAGSAAGTGVGAGTAAATGAGTGAGAAAATGRPPSGVQPATAGRVVLERNCATLALKGAMMSLNTPLWVAACPTHRACQFLVPSVKSPKLDMGCHPPALCEHPLHRHTTFVKQ